PCANMLAGLPLEKVVIANIDTSKKVDGRGLEILRQAGKIVSAGLMAEEGLFLNRRFFTFEQKKRPYIILKWARTHDGFIAREDYSSKWISNALSRKLVHKWRSEEPAIMVGKNTARYDNPALTVRDWTGNDPLRIVTDRHLELPSNLQLFDGKVSTLYYNLLKADKHENLEYIKLNPEQYLEQLVTDLASRDIQSVIIEGGATLLRSFIDLGLWDEARVFKSNKIFEKGITAPQIKGLLPVKSSLGSDELNIYYRDGA
ncbi:MAG: bifunctional diaminohydroxyphosphoribosylaminopyrimidine deaminase/5-amino-6-(5-phosphoribosylamino)uracil reductase RibD, partial [Cyclobacteriaceae bacterium]|nr:bifunctional diaminohydroxyphosphoribosylaminopyrimidine deaminase/5-amino-6-(5-phosphoribosylamino)uracil reductase RibD [Cyclobacteriaceae bacterium]